MTTTYAPRPATEIDPPLSFTLPQRVFLSKTERLALNRDGKPTLGVVRPPQTYRYNGPRRVWDSEKKCMVDLTPDPPKPRVLTSVKDDDVTKVPVEYHMRESAVAPKTRIFTPCANRPCRDADHVDVRGRVIALKDVSKPVEDVDLPPFDGPVLGYPNQGRRSSSPASPGSTASTPPISTATAPRLGSGTDATFRVTAEGEAEPVRSAPSLLRGTKRWCGQVLPSFRAPAHR